MRAPEPLQPSASGPMPIQSHDTAELDELRTQLAEERRRREIAEAQLDRRYERLSNDPATDYFIYAADLDSRLTYVSPSAERILGFTPEQMIGRDWREFVDQQASSFSMAEANEEELLAGADSPTKLIALRRADGRSLLMEVTPRTLHGAAGGVVGHEGVCKEATNFDDAEVRLRAVSDDLEVRVRRRTAELEYRIQFEKLLVSLSTGFISLPLADLDSAVQNALRKVGEFTGVDRCSLSVLRGELMSGRLTHEWFKDGSQSFAQYVTELPEGSFDWEFGELAKGGSLVLEDTDDAPEEASGFRRVYREFGVRSALHLPMVVGDRFIGMITCATIGRRFRWQQEHIDLIRVLAEVVANTLQRMNSEHRLAQSERRLQEIVRDQTEMIVRWTPERGHLFVNDAVCRFLGKPASQILGTDVLDNIHREDLQQVRKKLESLTPEAPLAVDEHRVIRNDGTLAWYQWVDRALFDENGEITEYQSVGRDITGLKRTQEELERRLRFEELVLGISTRLINPPRDKHADTLNGVLQALGEFTQVDRCFLYIIENDVAVLRYFWSSAAAPPVSDTIRSFPMSALRWEREAMLRGEPLHVPSVNAIPYDAEGFRKALDDMHSKSFINVPMLSDGELVGYMGFATHTQERQWTEEEIALLRLIGEILVSTMARTAAEQALEQSRELLRQTIEGVEEGVYDWNIKEKRVVVSDYWLRTLGLPPGENVRHEEEWLERIHPDDLGETHRALQEHFAGQTPVFEAEYRIRHSDGRYHWNLNRGRVIQRGGDDRPLRMVGVDRDITQMIEARDKRRVLESQLAHLGRVATMGETVAGIAHEVNQPLHAASTFNAAGRSALAAGKQEKAESLYQKSSEQISRAGDIIRRMREYTRPRPTEISFLDVNQLLRRSADFVMGYNTSSRASVSFDLDESIPQVQGDPVQLQQVAVNLIQNGLDAIRDAQRDEGEIHIVTRTGEKQIEIRFSDNGKGADGADPDELFDAFFSTKPNGMGIGLALCRRIIETHNGEIHARQNEPAGMTFVIRIPVAEGAA